MILVQTSCLTTRAQRKLGVFRISRMSNKVNLKLDFLYSLDCLTSGEALNEIHSGILTKGNVF